MQYRLLDSLGFLDAGKCNKDFGASIALDKAKLVAGEIVELSPKAAEYLNKKYPALLEPAGKVKGEAKEVEVKAPAK